MPTASPGLVIELLASRPKAPSIAANHAQSRKAFGIQRTAISIGTEFNPTKSNPTSEGVKTAATVDAGNERVNHYGDTKRGQRPYLSRLQVLA